MYSFSLIADDTDNTSKDLDALWDKFKRSFGIKYGDMIDGMSSDKLEFDDGKTHLELIKESFFVSINWNDVELTTQRNEEINNEPDDD